MSGFGNLKDSTPMQCSFCRSPLLASAAWEKDRYPTYRCGTISFLSAGPERSGWCLFRALFFGRRAQTREQELAEETLAMERAAAEIEFEREMKKARAELDAETI